MDNVINISHFYVCEVEALGNGEIRQVAPPGQGPVAVYRVGDAFYATDDVCSHGQECPWHGGSFDVRTGEALSFPCVLPIKVYPVKIEEGKVYLDLGVGEVRL